MKMKNDIQKTKYITIRSSEGMLKLLKYVCRKNGIPYAAFIEANVIRLINDTLKDKDNAEQIIRETPALAPYIVDFLKERKKFISDTIERVLSKSKDEKVHNYYVSRCTQRVFDGITWRLEDLDAVPGLRQTMDQIIKEYDMNGYSTTERSYCDTSNAVNLTKEDYIQELRNL